MLFCTSFKLYRLKNLSASNISIFLIGSLLRLTDNNLTGNISFIFQSVHSQDKITGRPSKNKQKKLKIPLFFLKLDNSISFCNFLRHCVLYILQTWFSAPLSLLWRICSKSKLQELRTLLADDRFLVSTLYVMPDHSILSKYWLTVKILSQSYWEKIWQKN